MKNAIPPEDYRRLTQLKSNDVRSRLSLFSSLLVVDPTGNDASPEPPAFNLEAIQWIEDVLSAPHAFEIPLDTSDIQHGQFDICQSYHLILLFESNHLRLYDHINELDRLPWDGRRWGPVNDIHWSDLKECFFILTWSRLYSLTIMKVKKGNLSTFTIRNIAIVDQIKSIDFRERPHGRKKDNRLRFLSLNSKGFAFLNRGYHTIEQWSIQTWVKTRQWRKVDLGLSDRDEMKLITCSRDGEHLAMNICLNEQSWVIDFRRIDTHLTLIKRLQSPQGSIWSHKLDVSSQGNSPITQWLIIDDRNGCYVTQLTTSSTPSVNNSQPKLIRTEGLPGQLSTGSPWFYFRWFYYAHFLVVSSPCEGERGKLCFFRIQRSE